MKIIFFLLFCLVITSALHSQTPEIDSLLQVQATAKEDTSKVNALNSLAGNYIWNDPKKAVEYALPALLLSQKLSYINGEFRATHILGEALVVSGNYERGMEQNFNGLKLAEKIRDPEKTGISLIYIASGYFYQGEYEQTIRYTKKSMEIPEYHNKSRFNEARANSFLGKAYFKLNKLDSALYHTQKAYAIEQELKENWSVPYYTLAGIHQAQKHYDLALEYFRLGLKGNQPNKDVVEGHLGLADVFYNINRNDSALYYARKVIDEGMKFGFMAEVVAAGTIAKNIFKKSGLRDSAFHYQDMVTRVKDSLFSQEKLRSVQNMTFNEQLRQVENQSKKLKEQEERKRNLQYVIIALAVITFVILFFIFSHSIIANQKLIRFLGILALLMVFEFINLFIHPFLDKITNHSIPLMLAIMICIGALLIPIHHKLEHWITHKMVEKNKKIRLAAARKTIARLEGEQRRVSLEDE